MPRAVLPAALLAVLALLVGCGGDDGSSADDYRADLDVACERLAEAQSRLPQIAQDEGLTVDEVRERADRNGLEFVETVEALDPPDDLRDAHDRLIELGRTRGPSGDASELVAWLEGIADVYGELGAEGCERGQRASARAVADSADGAP